MARRLITCLPELGFPHFPRFCSHIRRQAAAPMGTQAHPRCFELVYIHSGMQYRATNGFNYPLSGGQALLIQPGHRHSTGIMPQGTGHVYWLHLRCDLKRPLLGLPRNESEAVFRKLRTCSTPAIELGRDIAEAFARISKTARAQAGVRTRLQIREALLHICNRLLQAPTAQTQDNFGAIFKHSELWDQPAMLAHKAGLSLSRLRARCKESIGVSLGDYLLQLRIQEAMKRLTHYQHQSITDIALDLGFSSSQYFATVFKRYTALTPSQFRQELTSPEGKRRIEKLGIV